MVKKLSPNGNSRALIVTKLMREHLGVTDEVEVSLTEGQIILRKPESPAKRFTREFARKHDRAMRKLAE